MTQSQTYVRRHLLDVLLDKIDEDNYPSSTMLDLTEALLDESDVREYADVLLAKVDADMFPSMSLIRRLERFA